MTWSAPQALAISTLSVGADGGDDGRAEMLAPLAENLADAARRRMDEDRVALLHAIGLPEQILRGQALEHHGGGLIVGDVVPQRDEVLDVDVAGLRIGAWGGDVGDAVADLEIRHAGTDGRHLAGAFAAGGEGQLRRVEAVAEVHVEVIDADGVVTDLRLAFAGGRQLDVLEFHHLGTAGLVNTNGAHRVSSPLILSAGYRDSPRKAEPVRPCPFERPPV